MAISAEKKKKVNALMASINKKYNKPVVNRCSEVEEELRVRFIPTKSLKLNTILNGGIARGRIAEFYGPSGSGKTVSCYEIVGQDMQNDPEAIWGWYETEGSFDMDQAENFGIDMDRLVFWEMTDEGAESGLDILESVIRNLGSDCKGIIVNSVAGLTPKSELDSLMGKQDMGTMAKMMSKLMRKITAIAGKNKIAIIFINQVRDKISLYGGTTTTGGKALQFFASQRVEFRKVRTEAGDGVKAEEYIKINAKVTKNRFAKGNPFVETTIFGRYGVGTDITMEILELAVGQGIIEKKAGGNYRYVSDAGEEYKWRGATNLMTFVDENKWFFKEVEAKINAGVIGTALDEDEIRAIEQQQTALAEELGEDVNDEIEDDVTA